MKIDSTVRAFYAGKDAILGDRNPYPAGTPEWRAWAHGFESEHGELPMTDDEVARAFARLTASN
jgi:hypothetical protein